MDMLWETVFGVLSLHCVRRKKQQRAIVYLIAVSLRVLMLRFVIQQDVRDLGVFFFFRV